MENNKEHTMTISADSGLFMYLQEKVCERKTKIEAYCNLLKKASDNFVSPILKNRNQMLDSNQCHVTITDLSVEWHWHRSTVRTFLEKLEEYGQIKIVRLPKSFIITMPMQDTCVDNSIGNNIPEFPQRLQLILSDWLSDKCTTRDVGEKCTQLLKSDITAFTDSLTDHYADSNEISQMKDEYISDIRQQLLENMVAASFQKVMHKSNGSSTETISAFFENDLGCDGESFLEASKVLAELLINGTSPSLADETPQTREQFNNLLISYKVLLANSFGHGRLL